METASDLIEMKNVVELPNDIIRLILLKLPSEPLIRFKVASKVWKDLISNADFMYQHYINNSIAKRERSTFSEFLVYRHQYWPRFEKNFSSLSVLNIDGKLNIKHGDSLKLAYFACDPKLADYDSGLFYPAGFGYYCLFEFHNKKVALWNPTIREIIVLPWPSFRSNIIREYGFAQVEYKDSVFSYKVGLMHTRYESGKAYLTIELYSSADNSWKLLQDCCCFKHTIGVGLDMEWQYPGTNIRRKFYFLTRFCKDDPQIVTFDMTTEEFGRLEVPNFLKYDSKYNLAKSILTKFDENSLCLLLYRGWKTLEVWLQSECGESWIRKLTVENVKRSVLVNALGMFVEGTGNGLYYCSYGPTQLEKLMTVDPEVTKHMQIAEYEESIVSFKNSSSSSLFK